MASYGYVDNDQGGRGNYGALDYDQLQYLVIYQHYGAPVEDHRRASVTMDQPISSNYARPGYSGEDQSSDDNPVFSKLRDLYLEYRDGERISDVKSKDDYRKPNLLLIKPTDDVDGATKSPVLTDGGRILPNFNTGPKQGQFMTPVLPSGNKHIGPEIPRSSDAATRHSREAVEKHDGVDKAIKPGVKQAQFTGPALQFRNKYNYPEMSRTLSVAKQHDKEASEKRDDVITSINRRDDYTKSIPPPNKSTDGFDTAIKPSINGKQIVSNVPRSAKQGQFTGLVSSPGKRNSHHDTSQSSAAANQHGKEAAEKHDSVVANVNNKDDYPMSNPPPSKPTDEFDSAIKSSLNGTQILSNVPRGAKQGHFTTLVPSPGTKNIHPEMSQTSGAAKQHGRETTEKHDGVTTNISSKPMNEIDTTMEGSRISNLPGAGKKAHYWGPVLALRKSNLQPEMTQSLKADKKHSRDSRGKFSGTISSYEAVEKYGGALVP